MEEKILAKGIFGGVFIPITISVLAAISFVISAIVDLLEELDGKLIISGAVLAIVLIAWAIVINEILKRRALIITNKRVVARAAFGFRTDIPITKITSVSMLWFGGIGCGSPSFKIFFFLCKNKAEIFDTISSEVAKRDI